MKKVISDNETETVTSSKVDYDKYYGVYNGSSLGFVTYRSGAGFQVQSSDKVTGCFLLDAKNTSNLTTYIEHLLSIGYTVYEFETSKELFKWLSDNV